MFEASAIPARSVALGLGVFSIALGLGELLATRRIAEKLDAEDHGGVIRGFGVREIVAGVGLLQAPAHSTRVWNRVGGDALDLAALGALAIRSPRNGWVWGALGFVAGVTVIDALTARALDRETGKASPARLEAAPA
jgi:hypothetical protein